MCTDFLISSADGAWVNGRSMEFGADLHTQLYVHAAQASATLQGLEGESMELTPRYSFVGASSYSTPLCTDGMNTAGLSAGALWLPGTQYQPLDLQHPERNVLCGFFINWMLAHCASTAEVRSALESGAVRVVGGKFLEKVGPLHFAVHDAQGNSMVIEFINGQPQIYDNPVAVLTNRPEFPWQLNNLRNYVNLSCWDTESITLGSLKVESTGHGTGLAGLPGNASPPSRFVRAAFLKQYAEQPQTATEAQALAFHLLNAVDIPLGTVRSKGEPSILHPSGKEECDYTQWVVVKDLSNKIFNIRRYSSPQAWCVNLQTLDFAGLSGKQIPIPNGPIAQSLLQ